MKKKINILAGVVFILAIILGVLFMEWKQFIVIFLFLWANNLQLEAKKHD